MPFEKGNNLGGRTAGAKGQKTRQWEVLGESIMSTHTERFNSILSGFADSEPEKFVELYLKTLEYFKPKLQRTELTGEESSEIVIKVVRE